MCLLPVSVGKLLVSVSVSITKLFNFSVISLTCCASLAFSKPVIQNGNRLKLLDQYTSISIHKDN